MAALGCWPWQSDRKKRHRNVIRLPGNAGSSLTATPPLQVSDSRHSTKARPKLSSNLRPLFTSTAYAVLLLFCFFLAFRFAHSFPQSTVAIIPRRLIWFGSRPTQSHGNGVHPSLIGCLSDSQKSRSGVADGAHLVSRALIGRWTRLRRCRCLGRSFFFRIFTDNVVQF